MPGKVHERIAVMRQIVHASICAISMSLPAWSEETPPPRVETEALQGEEVPPPVEPPAQESEPDGEGAETSPGPGEATPSPAGSAPPTAEASPAPEEPARTDELTSPLGDTYRPIGTQLFPLYEHYLRTADNTTVRNILYLYRSTSRPPPNSRRSLLVAPLFYFREQERPPSSRFYLFPLLYFSGRDETASFTYIVPFYFDDQDEDSGYRYLFPLWLQTTSEGRQLTRDHVLYPLFRLTRDLRYSEASLTSSRLGIPRVLEFWESRSSEWGTDITAFNFFNWSDETKSGIALYRSSWTGEGGEQRGNTYLFPLYWHRKDLDGGFLAVLPLYLQGDRGGRHFLWQFPLFGYSIDDGNVDVDLIPLMPRIVPPPEPTAPFSLSHLLPPSIFTYSTGPDRFGVSLRPLFQYYESPGRFSVAVRPFYNYARDENLVVWGSLFGLYRHTYTVSTGKQTFSLLYPLVHHDVEPDGSRGDRWYFPYYETFNEDRRWRWVLPILFLERESLSAGEVSSFWSYGLPTYFAWGSPEDYFGFGFPLYWESHSGESGWRTFFPLYWDFYSGTERSWFMIPLFVHRRFPSLIQDSLVWPFFMLERFYDLEGERRGTGVHLLWPLIKMEVRDDGYDHRLLPLFSISKHGEYRGLLLTPFFYRQKDPRGSHLYFIPLYGRRETDRTVTDFYAGGSVITTTEKNLSGETARERLDLLWGLASHEEDFELGGSHTHVLPLMYWNTSTPDSDRNIVGPLYYSHRIVENEKEHRLKLVLGNLFLSKVTYGPASEVHPAASAAGGAATEEAAVLTTTPEEASASAPRTVGPRGATRTSRATGRSLSSQLFPLAFGQDESSPAGPRPPPPPGGTAAPPGLLNPLGSEETGTVEAIDAPPAPPERVELSRDEGFLWPLIRRYRDASGATGQWIAPFYFKTTDQYADTFALFPFYFEQSQTGRYSPSFFRYLFFLSNREKWREGQRWTFGQILVDWFEDERLNQFRLRLVYPLIEYERNRDGYSFDISSIVHVENKEASGERRSTYRFFPIYWQGRRERQKAGEAWELDREHFFLFPLFGEYSRSTRSDYYVMFPLFHLQDSADALRFELWPTLFYRNEPSLLAFRLWPFHTDETGELAGDFWVSRFLFLSKRFVSADRSSYRLEPFLFRVSEGEDEFGIATLFEAFAYDRRGENWSFHAIPLAFGYREEEASTWGIIPLFYYQHFGKEAIDYATPWRFFFPVNRLQGGDGERHTSILGFLFDYTDNPTRPEFSQTKVLLGLYLNRRTETSRQWALQPFVSYYRDETEKEEDWGFLFNIYSYQTIKGQPRHTLFWFISF